MSLRIYLMAGSMLASASLGCGSGSPFDYVNATGSVTYEDGSRIPAGSMEIRFYAMEAPAAGDAKPRPAIAHANEEGKFDVITSYKYGDGLIPGKHRVAIMEVEGKDNKPLIPREYTNPRRTPLVFDTADTPFDIKIPKP